MHQCKCADLRAGSDIIYSQPALQCRCSCSVSCCSDSASCLDLKDRIALMLIMQKDRKPKLFIVCNITLSTEQQGFRFAGSSLDGADSLFISEGRHRCPEDSHMLNLTPIELNQTLDASHGGHRFKTFSMLDCDGV